VFGEEELYGGYEAEMVEWRRGEEMRREVQKCIGKFVRCEILVYI
jgi:hypothetical protein